MTPTPDAAPDGDSAGPPARDTDVLVLAELNPDLLLAAPSAAVRFGQVETELIDTRLTLGSSGAITAAALVNLGLSVRLAALVGEDTFGSSSTELLAETGVDVSLVQRRADLRTGLTVVLNAPDGDRALLTHPGAMAELRVSDVPEEAFATTRHVHVSSVFLQHALRPELPELFARLKAEGVTTSLDTGWDPAESWAGVIDILPALSVLLPNEAELAALADAAGVPVDRNEPAWVARAAEGLAQYGPTVAVKLGGRGGSVASPAGAAGVAVAEIATAPAEPIDTTGAGDNFNAGFLAGLLAGRPPEECLAGAVAAGAVAITGHGGTGRMITPDERDRAVAELMTRLARRPDRTP